MSLLAQITPGESTNAVPHYHKLCSRVSHIWGNRTGQHIRSAMDKPRPGKTTFMIMVSPLPGKYYLFNVFSICIIFFLIADIGNFFLDQSCYEFY